MWIHISKIAKTIIFFPQTDVESFHKLFFFKSIHNYCRKHRKFAKFVILHNRMEISEKFSPIVTKFGIFSNATAIVLQTSTNCSHTKLSKQQLTALTSIVKRIVVSVTNTHLSSSNALLCQLVSQTHKLLKQIKPTDIANYNINIS